MILWKGMGTYADKLCMWRCGVYKSLPLALAENNNLLEIRPQSKDLFHGNDAKEDSPSNYYKAHCVAYRRGSPGKRGQDEPAGDARLFINIMNRRCFSSFSLFNFFFFPLSCVYKVTCVQQKCDCTWLLLFTVSFCFPACPPLSDPSGPPSWRQ